MIWCLWQSQLVICLQTMRPIRHAAKTYSLLPVVIYFYHAMQASLSCNTSDVTNNAACVSPEAFFPRTVQKCRREPAGAPAANKELKKRQKKRKEKTAPFGINFMVLRYWAAQARTRTLSSCTGHGLCHHAASVNPKHLDVHSL